MRQGVVEGRFPREPPTRQPHRFAPRHPVLAVVVPDHSELDTGTLRAVIRQAGLEVEDCVDLLD